METSQIGANGIWRLYREYPVGHEKLEERLVGVFAIVGGVVHHLEDHDGILDDIVPEGRLNDRTFMRMLQLENSAYWRLVFENDIHDGEHPELLPEATGGEPWRAEAPSASVKVPGEPVTEE